MSPPPPFEPVGGRPFPELANALRQRVRSILQRWVEHVRQSIISVGAGGLRGRGVSGATQTGLDYLPEHFDFKNGKMYANQRPGLGVTPEMKLLTLIGEVTEPGRRNVFRRPDGSLTHW